MKTKTLATLAILASIIFAGCANNRQPGGGGFAYNPYAAYFLNRAYSQENQTTIPQRSQTMHDYDYMFNNPNPVKVPTYTNCRQFGTVMNASINCSSY